METHSTDKKVLITSSADLGNGMVVNYYKSHLHRPEDLQYVDQATLKADYARTNGFTVGAEWLILHLYQLTKQPARVTDEYGNSYQLVSYLPILRPFRLELAAIPQPQSAAGGTAGPVCRSRHR